MEDERISQLGKSETVIDQNIKSLKQLFPQVFTEDKINFSLLEDLLGDKIEDRNEYYELSWAGKSDARKELSKSTTATLTPIREKSVDFDNTKNLFIEGENLEVLRTLQKSYFGKIKMIYIDPPYNTGSDSFVYPDNYSETKKEYEKRIGKVDEEGYINKVELWKQNTKENGQYHSVWLSMMYSRLSYAHSLLSDDGVIFISIDDNEQANLKLLCDCIFGEDNFLGQFTINTTPNARDYGHIGKMHEFVLFYSKNRYETVTNLLPEENKTFKYVDNISPFNIHPLYNSNVAFTNINRPNLFYPFYLNPNSENEKGFCEISLIRNNNWIEIYPPLSLKDNVQFVWRWGKEKSNNNLNKEIIGYKTKEGEYRIVQKMRHNEKLIRSIISDKQYSSRRGTAEIEELFKSKSFSFPKPISLIKDFINISTSEDSIVLDFFAGSCTTGHAVMELNKEDGGNRKFICIQMPEKIDKKSEAYKQGYEKISDIGAERLRRAGKRIKEEIEKERKENDGKLLDKKEIKDIDTGFKYYRLTPSHFKVWQNDINENELSKQLDAFIDATKEGSVEEEMLYELILKSGFSLTTPIEKNSKGFYYIKEWQTCIALENFNKETIESIFELKPKEVITLDKFFENNDSLLSNTRLEFKDKEIILTII
ncbi:MAG: site-specific DNA-methyltransferase [Bacteroidales bacterium]